MARNPGTDGTNHASESWRSRHNLSSASKCLHRWSCRPLCVHTRCQCCALQPQEHHREVVRQTIAPTCFLPTTSTCQTPIPYIFCSARSSILFFINLTRGQSTSLSFTCLSLVYPRVISQTYKEHHTFVKMKSYIAVAALLAVAQAQAPSLSSLPACIVSCTNECCPSTELTTLIVNMCQQHAWSGATARMLKR